MWTRSIGLVNGQYKYLTAEQFGNKVNANGASLRNKQLWSIESFPLDNKDTKSIVSNEDQLIAIKSHLGRYLTVDTYGNVACSAESKDDFARFSITLVHHNDIKGNPSIYWAFRNIKRGYYLGVMSDGMLTCTGKEPKLRSELWHVHMIPSQGSILVSLRSIGRKRYARSIMDDNGRKVFVDKTSPWNSECLFHLIYHSSGQYVLSHGGLFLNNNGELIESKSDSFNSNLLYFIQYHAGNIAFCDCNGNYLAATGRQSILRSRSQEIGKEELFVLETARVEVSLRALFNKRFVSVKQGVDLSANQSESSDHETFTLDYIEKTQCFTLRTFQGNYWTLGLAATIQTSTIDERQASHFKFIWNDDGTCSIKGGASMAKVIQSGEDEMKWITNRKSGQLCTASGEPVKFSLMIKNRQSLALRSENNCLYFGVKGTKIEVNKLVPDHILIEEINGENDETVSFVLKVVSTGKYLSVNDNVVVADCGSPSSAQRWCVEIHRNGLIAFRSLETGEYMSTSQSSVVTRKPENTIPLWEF